MGLRERCEAEPKEKGLRWGTRKGLGRLQGGMVMPERSLAGSVQNNHVKQRGENSVPERGNSTVCRGAGREDRGTTVRYSLGTHTR